MSSIDDNELYKLNHYSRRQYITAKMAKLGRQHLERLISHEEFDKQFEHLFALLKVSDAMYNELLKEQGYTWDETDN